MKEAPAMSREESARIKVAIIQHNACGSITNVMGPVAVALKDSPGNVHKLKCVMCGASYPTEDFTVLPSR